MKYIDTDKNGKINYTEFISSCLENSTVYKEENLLSVFRMLDRDNNGSI
jgi:Ca2+-binding EF-hand superfamily protein